MTTSLMMVTYNRLNLTKLSLESIMKTVDVPFRLIIVDNASTDDTKQFLTEFAINYSKNSFLQDITVHYSLKNEGIAKGRNRALKIADEYNDEWLCTIDNDVSLPYGWLDECIKVLQSNPKLGACGVNLENVNYPIITTNGITYQIKPQGNLGSATMVFNRSIHKLLGFFNTEYFRYGHEDADWGMRLRVIGKQLAYIKENGQHLGIGDNDKGEYREMKDHYFQENLDAFHKNAAKYFQGKKSYYIPFKE